MSFTFRGTLPKLIANFRPCVDTLEKCYGFGGEYNIVAIQEMKMKEEVDVRMTITTLASQKLMLNHLNIKLEPRYSKS